MLLVMLCGPLLDAKSDSLDSLSQISIFKDFMSGNQLVFFGSETGKALLWAGYAWFIITYFGAMVRKAFLSTHRWPQWMSHSLA